jgi:hypothetical protein
MGLGAGYKLNVLPLLLLRIISHLFRSLVTIIELLLKQRGDLNSEHRPAKGSANAAFPHMSVRQMRKNLSTLAG